MGCLEKLSNSHWKDAAAIEMAITHKVPEMLALDLAYQNARKYSDPQNTQIEGELAVERAISTILSDYVELFQKFTQDADFRERLTSFVLMLMNDQRST